MTPHREQPPSQTATIELPPGDAIGLAARLQERHEDLVDALAVLTASARGTAAAGEEEIRARRAQLAAVAELLAQIPAPGGADRERIVVTGARDELWSAAYSALCLEVEELLEFCGDYWRGESSGDELAARIAAVGASSALMEGVGRPPGAAPEAA